MIVYSLRRAAIDCLHAAAGATDCVQPGWDRLGAGDGAWRLGGHLGFIRGRVEALAGPAHAAALARGVGAFIRIHQEVGWGQVGGGRRRMAAGRAPGIHIGQS